MKGEMRKALKRECVTRGGARRKCHGFKFGRNRRNEVRTGIERIKIIKIIKKRKLKNPWKNTSRFILLPWTLRQLVPPKRW
jgi:hypothetical protein